MTGPLGAGVVMTMTPYVVCGEPTPTSSTTTTIDYASHHLGHRAAYSSEEQYQLHDAAAARYVRGGGRRPRRHFPNRYRRAATGGLP